MNGTRTRSVLGGPEAALTLFLCCVLIAFGIFALLLSYLQPLAPAWRNMTSDEAIAFAETGKNLARGRGFTTEWIFPCALKYARGIDRVPDLYNPPLYPLALGLFFAVFGPHSLTIFICAGALFLATGVCVFLFGREAFGHYPALTAAALFLSNPLMHRTVLHGQSTPLLVLLMTILFWRVYASQMAAPRDNLLIGALAGLCYLTDYPYWVLLIPLLVSCAASGPQRGRNLQALIGGFCAASAWWWLRNTLLTGNPFFTLRTGAGLYGRLLTCALDPAVRGGGDLLAPATRLTNLWLQSGELLSMYGNWLVALFVAAAFWRCDDRRMQWARNVLYGVWATVWVLVGSWTRFITTGLPFLPLVCIIVSGFVFRIATVLNLKRVPVCIALAAGMVAANTLVLPRWAGLPGLPYEWRAAFLDRIPSDRTILSDLALRISWLKDRPAIEIPLEAADCAKIAAMLPGGAAVYLSPDFSGDYVDSGFSSFWGGVLAAAQYGSLSPAMPLRHGELVEDNDYLFY